MPTFPYTELADEPDPAEDLRPVSVDPITKTDMRQTAYTVTIRLNRRATAWEVEYAPRELRPLTAMSLSSDELSATNTTVQAVQARQPEIVEALQRVSAQARIAHDEDRLRRQQRAEKEAREDAALADINLVAESIKFEL